MAVLLGTDPRLSLHDTGPGHPERPARLAALVRGISEAGPAGALVPFAPRNSTRAELVEAHDPDLLDGLARLCEVAIVDYDDHHGNGTQEIFYGDPRVLYVSCHQLPLYPGTGRVSETGAGAGTARQHHLP